MRATALLLLAAVTLLAASAADVVPPGYKSVRHVLVLQEDERLEKTTLFLSPTRGFGGVDPFRPGAECSFSGKYGTRVYALPVGAAVPETPDALRAAAIASGDLPVGHIANVPVTDPTRTVISTVRLVSIEDGKVALAHVETRRLGEDGKKVSHLATVLVIAGVGTVGLLLVGALFLRRRRCASQD